MVCALQGVHRIGRHENGSTYTVDNRNRLDAVYILCIEGNRILRQDYRTRRDI